LNIRLVKKEIKNYMNSPKPDSKTNAVEFWKQNKEKFPSLMIFFFNITFKNFVVTKSF
jgi:hypothetical protein